MGSEGKVITMTIRPEPEWELAIGPDTVRLFIQKARAVNAGISEDYDDGHEHEVELDDDGVESHHHDGLVEEEEDNLTETELRELIDDLNVDEAAELVALVWVGRGDYSASEWTEAVAEARANSDKSTSNYLLGMPMLSDWLEEGLEVIGV